MMDKVCQVNLIRLRTTNPRLLRIGGVPCKIYLDCFSPHEFVKLTNLITMYGGVVLPPDDETVVLVKDAESESKCYPRFSVQWLYDTVNEGELQDVGKYLIPVELDAIPARTIKYFPIIHANCASSLNLGVDAQPSTSAADGQSTPRASPVKKLATKRERAPVPRKSTAEDTRQGADQGTPNESEGADEENPVITAEKRRVFKTKVPHERKRDHSSTDPEDTPKRKRRSQKTQRSMSVGDEPHDRSANSEKCKSDGGDRESDSDSVTLLTEVSASTVSRRSEVGVRKEKRRRSPLENKNISCLEELKNQSISDETQQRVSTKKYSNAENRKIMQYLVDKNKISQAYRYKTWEEMEAEQILEDPPRSANSMMQHFNRAFINLYKKYTKDPAVIAEFEKLERRKLKNIVNYFNIGHSSEEDA